MYFVQCIFIIITLIRASKFNMKVAATAIRRNLYTTPLLRVSLRCFAGGPGRFGGGNFKDNKELLEHLKSLSEEDLKT